MARGLFRGAAGAVLGLAALDAVVSDHGADTTKGVMSFAASVLNRALSPDVALIPDFSKGGTSDGGLDPTVTGAASSDGSTGHNYNVSVTPPAPAPKTSNPNPIPRPGAAVPN